MAYVVWNKPTFTCVVRSGQIIELEKVGPGATETRVKQAALQGDKSSRLCNARIGRAGKRKVSQASANPPWC